MYGLNTDESTGINVLETLQAKNLSCDFHIFVNSTDNSENEYKVFINDLRQYCSNSKSTKPYQLLCYMILIELEIGCSLLKKIDSLPINYITSHTQTDICSTNNILYINRWIWKKLKSNEKNQIGTTSTQLCFTITSFNETLRLARFFYELAPFIREIDAYNMKSSSHKTLTDSLGNRVKLVKGKHLKKQNKKKIEQEDQLLVNNINIDSQLLKHNVVKDKITKNKTQLVLDLEQEQINLNINKTKNIRNNLEQIDETESKLVHKRKMNEGIPLGRDEELPERVQINERPKPKALDIEVVFKSNDGEKRNWIEGRDGENKEENEPRFNLLQYNRTKFQENQLINPPMTKKKFKLKPKLKLHSGDENDGSNNIMTGFLVFILCVIIIYLILSNKNKILGLIIEGCKRRRAMNGRHVGASSSSTRLTRPT
ncbi:unnamed protein product [Rotaria sordida]|uniref:Uncharacterized protein n=1 Tax=Rotaria sordida TaxID=392033 RepID=A0A818QDC5_9BILA|nr:unnamed protein product [Rotaria sordida]